MVSHSRTRPGRRVGAVTILARSVPYRKALYADERVCTRCGITFKLWHPKKRGEHTRCKDCR